MTTKEMIEVMSAFDEGKMIECKLKWQDDERDWTYTADPGWNWNSVDYRIKKVQLPQTWEEFCENYPVKEGEALIEVASSITTVVESAPRDKRIDANYLPNKEYAEAVLTLCKLLQLKNCYNEGWEPNWNNDNVKYCIIRIDGSNVAPKEHIYIPNSFAFKTEALRDKFLANFEDLLLKLFPIW